MDKTEMIQHGAAGALLALFIFWFMKHSEPIIFSVVAWSFPAAYTALCTIIGSLLCGPLAFGCVLFASFICPVVMDYLIYESANLSIDEINEKLAYICPCALKCG
jgi:hypothetical protein